jgi:hypothetical protein
MIGATFDADVDAGPNRFSVDMDHIHEGDENEVLAK